LEYKKINNQDQSGTFEGGICHYNIIKPSLYQGGGFLLCARQGAFTWRWKFFTGQIEGTVSRTARVSIAR